MHTSIHLIAPAHLRAVARTPGLQSILSWFIVLDSFTTLQEAINTTPPKAANMSHAAKA
jgi:hypothetical protein